MATNADFRLSLFPRRRESEDRKKSIAISSSPLVYKLLGGGVLLFLLLFSSSCKDEIPIVNLKDSANAYPIESGKFVAITYSDSAQIKLKIYADQMDRFAGEKQYVEMPKGVKINFFNEQMRVISELTAKYAIRYDTEKKMEAKKDVVVTNDKGETLNTEQLIWDEKRKIIYTNEMVKVTTPKEIIIGEGLEAAEDFSKYVIKNIQGTINLEDNE